LKFEKHYVKPCKDSEFHGINCLQMDDGNKFGFFNSEADVSLDAKKKIWNPNRETAVNLVGLWGLETDGWVGNKVLCSIVENKVVGVPIKDVATAPAVEEKVVDTTAPVVAPPIPPSDAEIKAQED